MGSRLREAFERSENVRGIHRRLVGKLTEQLVATSQLRRFLATSRRTRQNLPNLSDGLFALVLRRARIVHEQSVRFERPPEKVQNER